jgi:hypothetical protein
MRSVRVLPTRIYQIYIETHNALCGDQPILAGIGIRAILDAVCKHKLAAGRSLELQIDDLVTKGLIASDSADFLHRIRYLGNKAAHEVEAHSMQELGAAMDIVEQLLQNVFVLPRLARTLPAAPSRPAAPTKTVKAAQASKKQNTVKSKGTK